MIITLSQQQIEAAIQDYVLARLTIAPDQRLDIDLRATRGDAGYTAEIKVIDADSPRQAPAAPAAEPTPVASIAARKPKPAPVAEQAPVETPDETPVAENDSPEEAAPAEAASDEPKRPSIFANMKKPTGKVGSEAEPA